MNACPCHYTQHTTCNVSVSQHTTYKTQLTSALLQQCDIRALRGWQATVVSASVTIDQPDTVSGADHPVTHHSVGGPVVGDAAGGGGGGDYFCFFTISCPTKLGYVGEVGQKIIYFFLLFVKGIKKDKKTGEITCFLVFLRF